MKQWACDLPPPMSLNNAYANALGGGRYTTAKGEKWKAKACQMVVAGGARPRFTGPVRVAIILNPAMSRASLDTDNCAKLPIDVLVTMGILPDDNRTIIRELCLTWRDVIPAPTGMRVIVESYEE